MNARNIDASRYSGCRSYSRHLPHYPKTSGLAKAVIFLTVIGMIISSSHVQAAPCFDNAQSAYDYLLATERSNTLARDQNMININRASESELVSLNGIGSRKAQAIILYRDMFGGFETVDELEKVKGIGKKTIENNRARLQVSD